MLKSAIERERLQVKNLEDRIDEHQKRQQILQEELE